MDTKRKDGQKKGDDVRERNREPHREGVILHETGQKPRHWQKAGALAQGREDNRRARPPDRLEVGRRDDIKSDAPKHAVRHHEIACDNRAQGGIVRRDERRGEPLWERRDDLDDRRADAERRRHPKAEDERGLDAAEVPCAPVVAENRLKPLLGAENRHDRKNEHTLIDAERGDLRRRCRFARCPAREGRGENDVDGGAQEMLEKRREADAARLCEQPRMKADAFEAQTDKRLLPHVKRERVGATQKHGEVRRPRRARDAEIEDKNEKRVEDEIRPEADDHARH